MRGERGGSVAVGCSDVLGFVIGVDLAGREVGCVEWEDARDRMAGVDIVQVFAHVNS
jgi:hypothetical protein